MNTPFKQLPRYTMLSDGTAHRIDDDEHPLATAQVYLKLEDVEAYFKHVQHVRSEAASAIMRLGTFLDQ